ncbi:MAG: TonB-dependent siderophore receptor [Luteitalea sp.]|nr:TonB-dependent siderophore receptor [Luteitalea sp.]
MKRKLTKSGKKPKPFRFNQRIQLGAPGGQPRPSAARRGGAHWVVMGALAASAAMGGRLVPAAYAQEARRHARHSDASNEESPLYTVERWPEFRHPAATELRDDAWSGVLVPDAGRGITASWGEPDQASDAARRFDIPPGPLGTVLTIFKEATGLNIVVPTENIHDVESPGVSGFLTIEQALEQLLSGTGVAYRFTAPQTLTLELRVESESVDVTGRLPRTASPKYTEPLRDVPQTITVIPEAVFEAQGATTLRDVLRNVTGISIAAGEGGVPAGDNLTIRGFSARTDIFIDGVRDFGGYARDPFNLEQVEVTKGPASAYAGRGSTGGAVNLTTKTPHLGPSYTAAFGGGTDAYRRGTIDVNQPIDGLGAGTSLRLNAMWTDAEVPGRDAVENQRWGVAPTLAFGLGTPTRVTVGYTHLAQDNVPDYGVPWVPGDNEALAEYADQPAPVDFRNFYGLTHRDDEDVVTGVATAQVEHDVNASLTLRSLTRYGRTRRDSIITAPRFASSDSTDIRRTDWKSRDQTDAIVATQTNLMARFRTGAIGHALTSGLELSSETEENHSRIETGPTPPSTDLFRPNPDDPYTGSIVRTGELTEADAASAALYAFDTVNVGEHWELSGGVRWDRFDVDYTPSTGETTERTDTMASWRGGVVYKPTPDGSIYLGYGTSFNPSAEGLSLSTGGGALAHVEPEKSRSYEVGTKWEAFGSRVSLNAALFRTDKTNARTEGLNPGDPPFVLDGEQRVSGVELGAAGNLTNAWRVFGGYTYMQSEITQSNEADEVGNAFGNTPDHSFSLWTSYRLPWDVEVGAAAQYVGDRFNNSSGARVAPSYRVFDAMAAYHVSDHLTLRLNVSNLANERYIDRVGGGHFIPGPGRSAALTTSVAF